MNFEADGDLALFLDAIQHLAARLGTQWAPTQHRHLYAPELARELEAGGYFGCILEESLGRVAAAAMVHELSRLPACTELVASALIGPLACPDLPRPLAVVWGDPARPTRFLPVARSVLWIHAGTVSAAALMHDDVVSQDSAFAYPMGMLRRPYDLAWTHLQTTDAAQVADLWRVGLAAEISGCLQAGLDAVVAHVTERRQFGRPLGSFQGIQHRLATAASAIQGARWLMLRAADSGSAVDAATAAGYAQGMATRISYDLHQFMGAMGLTLEHPLHRWTYRVKLLRSDLGGAEMQFRAVADLAWEPSHSNP